MSSIFTKIINGDIPCHKIAETDKYFAFLDIRPLSKGHTLVIPKEEVDYFFDMEDDLIGEIMPFAKKVAKAIKRVISCKRVGVVVAGLEVPHAHIHLIPMNEIVDLSWTKGTLTVSQEELGKIAAEIRANL